MQAFGWLEPALREVEGTGDVRSATRFRGLGYFPSRSDESQNPRPTNRWLDRAPVCSLTTQSACPGHAL